jgi:hypothetical protein
MTGIFASRWWIVFACACGLLVGAGAILIFTFGVFLKPVTDDLGVSRGELSSALGASTWFVAASSAAGVSIGSGVHMSPSAFLCCRCSGSRCSAAGGDFPFL